MQRHLAIVISSVVLAGGAGSAALVAHASGPSGSHPADGSSGPKGDATRVFTLCDSTDRAVVTVNDAKIVGSALVSDNLVITCTNTNATVKLKVRYEVIDKNIIRETVTSQTNEPVDKIIFYRVSEP
jgi:hypothetical protein